MLTYNLRGEVVHDGADDFGLAIRESGDFAAGSGGLVDVGHDVLGEDCLDLLGGVSERLVANVPKWQTLGMKGR